MMITYARYLLAYLMWYQPHEIVTGAALLSIGGVLAGAGTSILARRRQEARTLTLEGLPLALAFVLFCLGDWALLWALPQLRLSFSEDIRLPLVVSLFVRVLVFWGLLGATLLARWRGHRRGVNVRTRSAIVLFLVANLGFSLVQWDAYILEPLLVKTTQVTLAFDDLDPTAPPVRVVHLTDTHIERASYREETIIEQVNALQPDIIVLSGDYLNLSRLSDPVSAAHFREFVTQLEAPYGIYAVRGSVDSSKLMAQLVEGTDVIWLEQESMTVNVRGQPVTLVGVACSHNDHMDTARLDEAMERVPPDAFTLLLYHSPDLIREAAERRVDLYLGGHTHGGQLRLPFLGPIVTGSKYGRRYAAGLFEVEGTRMYISQGIGFEGSGMPRARFLCRPEIVNIELFGSNQGD